jgi:hypothetical protein
MYGGLHPHDGNKSTRAPDLLTIAVYLNVSSFEPEGFA